LRPYASNTWHRRRPTGCNGTCPTAPSIPILTADPRAPGALVVNGSVCGDAAVLPGPTGSSASLSVGGAGGSATVGVAVPTEGLIQFGSDNSLYETV